MVVSPASRARRRFGPPAALQPDPTGSLRTAATVTEAARTTELLVERIDELLGCEQPRVFTPPLRELTPETSLGFSVIEFATTVLMITLHPWQRWLLIHALELLEDGSLRFRTVVVLVARQNGKSTLSKVLALYFMYVLGVALVLGTAQDLDTAEEVWQGCVDLVEELDEDDEPVRPELAELVDKVVKTNGKKSLNLNTQAKSRYKVKAATRGGGRGLSGDLIVLDELREHQTWSAWSAITKTTMARAAAMVWALSNAGDRLSVVLNFLRKRGHAGAGDPDGLNANDQADDGAAPDEVKQGASDLGLFEWSASPGCDVWDRQGWAQANPSLGHPNGIAERTIASAAGTDPEPEFRTEVLCQTVETTDKLPIPPDLLADVVDKDSSRVGEVVFAVHVTPSRDAACIAVAGRRKDGLGHLEIVEYRRGSAWVVDRLLELAERHDAWEPVLNGKGQAAAFVPEMELRGLRPKALTPTEEMKACGTFLDDVEQRQLRIQPGRHEAAVTSSVIGARQKVTGDGWRWIARDSDVDLSLVVAMTDAWWGLASAPPVPLEDTIW